MSSFVLFLLRLRIVRSLPVLFSFLIASPAQGQTGIALVQHAGKDGGTTTTTSLAFPNPNIVGNWIAVCVRGGFSSSQVFSIHDSNGNLYRRASQIGFTGSAVTLAIFYAENIIGGANTVTVSDTVSAPLRVAILEYSGVATSNSLDAAVAGTGNSASPATPVLTTAANGDLLLASIATTNPASFRPGSGYAISDFVPAEPNSKLIAEEQIQASAGSASGGAFLSASDAWGAVLAAVKAASNGTGSTAPSITGLSPTSGPVGASVTITGTNFGATQDASAVQFNGTAAAPVNWSDTAIVAPVPNGAATGSVVVTVGGVPSNAMSFIVTTTAVAPTITAQPTNQTVTAGQTASFVVSASGTAPLGYQWQKNGANISGATSSSYTTPATTTSDSGSTFDVVVTNSVGSVTSNAAALTVNASVVAPTLATQPSNQTVTAGQTATFAVTANGTAPLSYQWQKNGANVAGATASSYTTPPTTTADSGSGFDVVVNNSAGTATSSSATLTVNSSVVAPTITAQPAGQTVTEGQSATFTVGASGTAPLSYQWQKNGADIPGATSPSYTTPATATSDSGSTFAVLVSNSAGSATSNAATLIVDSTSTSSPGWTFVQDQPMFFCTGPANGCNITIGNMAPTTAGTIWVLMAQYPAHGVTMTSVTGGGGTWVHCPNCHVDNPNGFDADAWYNLCGTDTGTYSCAVGTDQNVRLTLSGSSGSFLSVNFYEILPPPGATVSYDNSGNAFTSAACSTCTAASPGTLSGTDVIIQNPGGGPAAGWNAWSTPYITTANGSGICLNCTSGTAPTINFSGSSTKPEFFALAFKSSQGTFTTPAKQYSIVNYTFNGGQNCSSSGCTLTIPSTGAGNLLFLESGDGSGSFISSVTGGGTWVVPSGTNTCQLKDTIAGQSMAASCAYVLSSSSGTTQLTIKMTGSANTGFAYWEVASTTNGTFALDAQGSSIRPKTAPPAGYYFSGQALPMTGSNDVIFQLVWDAGGSAGPTYYAEPASGGTANYFFFNQAASVVLTDSGSSPPIPVWTNPQAGQDDTFVTAVAFTAP